MIGGGWGIEIMNIGRDVDSLCPIHHLLLQWENHILPMKVEKLFSIIDGACTRDMRSIVFEFAQDRIETVNIPACQKEYLLDQLFLSWISIEKTMIIDMLNSAMHYITVGDDKCSSDQDA